MNTYEEIRSVPGPFPGGAPLECTVEFYRANGYALREMAADSDRNARRAVLERGQASTGWWSSNTARLPSRVEINYRDGELEIRYRVDDPGQPLTENDRDFWRREMRAAANQARNPNRRPVDLRHEAAKSAEHVRRRLLSYGIWAVLYLLIFVVLVNVFTNGAST